MSSRASARAARGETPAAFGRRCIPADCVAPPSHMDDMLGRRALSSRRLAVLGATLALHHGLPVSLALARLVEALVGGPVVFVDAGHDARVPAEDLLDARRKTGHHLVAQRAHVV